jgi:nucleotide-binding universal stress UspA family protein
MEAMLAPVPGPDIVTGSIFDPAITSEPEIMNIQKEISENLIENTIRHFAGDLKVTQFSEFGTSADGILDCSAQFGADLIIVGTHSRSGLDRFLMGSVAEHVVRHSKVPVLVIPFVEKD